MALKVLVSILLLCQDLMAKDVIERRGKLLFVLPVVIYRGKRPWKAPRSHKELIEEPCPGCGPHVPSFSFCTIRTQHEPKPLLRELNSIMYGFCIYNIVYYML